jgi:hypothetical protein
MVGGIRRPNFCIRGRHILWRLLFDRAIHRPRMMIVEKRWD